MFSSINFYLSSIYFYLILKSHIFIDFAAKGPGKPMNIKMQFTLKNGRTKIVGMYSKTLKGAIIALSHIWWRNFCNTKNITQLDGDKIQPLGYMWCKPKNVTQKKKEMVHRNMFISSKEMHWHGVGLDHMYTKGWILFHPAVSCSHGVRRKVLSPKVTYCNSLFPALLFIKYPLY